MGGGSADLRPPRAEGLVSRMPTHSPHHSRMRHAPSTTPGAIPPHSTTWKTLIPMALSLKGYCTESPRMWLTRFIASVSTPNLMAWAVCVRLCAYPKYQCDNQQRWFLHCTRIKSNLHTHAPYTHMVYMMAWSFRSSKLEIRCPNLVSNGCNLSEWLYD